MIHESTLPYQGEQGGSNLKSIFNLIITSYLLKDTILEQEKQTKLVNLLQSWIDEEDEQEQQETGEYLIEALDQDRLSERPLFLAHLKGVTW